MTSAAMLETLKPPPTLPPGVTVEGWSNKFGGWQGKTGYYDQSERYIDPFRSDAKAAQDGTRDFSRFSESYNINKALKAEQRGVNLARVEREYSSSLMTSTMKTGYINSGTLRANVGEANPDDFRTAFEQYMVGNSDTIDSRDVKRMVVMALGDFQPDYVIDKYVVLIAAAAVNRRISWDQVSNIVPKASSLIKEECSPKREKAIRMGEKITIDKGLGSGEMLSTNYRDNFRTAHEVQPLAPGETKSQRYAKKPLYLGTTKAVGHTPGYLGHIPTNIVNPHKESHAQGKPHPIQNDLMLTRKGTLSSMGNYSGHIPQYTVMKNERCSGCDPRSTMGASFNSNGDKLMI